MTANERRPFRKTLRLSAESYKQQCAYFVKPMGVKHGRWTVRQAELIDVMRVFKSTSTIQVNREFRTPGLSLWQRSYFDHIIRDAEDMRNHQRYIVENPMRWSAKE